MTTTTNCPALPATIYAYEARSCWTRRTRDQSCKVTPTVAFLMCSGGR